MRAAAPTLLLVASCGAFGASASDPDPTGASDASAAADGGGPDGATVIDDAGPPDAESCRPTFSDGFDGPALSADWELEPPMAGTYLNLDATKSQAGGQSVKVLLDASSGSRVSFLKKSVVGNCPVTIDAWYQPERVPAADEDIVYLALALEDTILSLRYAAKIHELVVVATGSSQRVSLPNLTPGTWSHLVMTYDAHLQKASVTVGANAPRDANNVKGLPTAVHLGAVLATPGASFSSWFDSFSVR